MPGTACDANCPQRSAALPLPSPVPQPSRDAWLCSTCCNTAHCWVAAWSRAAGATQGGGTLHDEDYSHPCGRAFTIDLDLTDYEFLNLASSDLPACDKAWPLAAADGRAVGVNLLALGGGVPAMTPTVVEEGPVGAAPAGGAESPLGAFLRSERPGHSAVDR